MTIRRFSGAVLFVAFAAAARREEHTKDFARTLALGAGERVSIENRFGDVTVRGMSQRDVNIKAVIRVQAGSQEEARKWADQVEVKVDQGGGILSVRTVYPEKKDAISFSVSYDITMPDSAPLEVNNKFAATSVADVKSDVSIRSSHGKVLARYGRGKWQIENAFGSVEALSNQGDVTVNNSHGAVTVNDASGAVSVKNRFAAVTVAKAGKDLVVTNQNGPVEARSVSGRAEVTTSFAHINLENVSGAVTVHNRNGGVKLRGAENGARVDTSFASVTAEEVSGAIDVNSRHGQIAVSGLKGKCAPLYLKTEFGAIRVSLPAGASYNAAAKTSFGHIASDFGSISKDGNKQTLSTRIGAAECDMSLTTHHGNIELRK